jgi:ABC-type transport system involved in cytochrome c biogenesis permease subunit
MPESLDKSQMPALNSPWYAPHVTLYMVSYAMMGLAAAVAIGALIWRMARKDANHAEGDEVVRRLVYLGFPLLTAGLITGAFWGQVAWGHYWTWDPKETWAFVTWAAYLAYLHLDLYTRIKPVAKLVLVTGAFLLLTFCWKGIQLLPSSGQSVHIYSGTN